MNAETLDRLLMDRALGGLPPDVEALLEAWLAQNPGQRERAGEFETAAATARAALRSELPTALPPLPQVRIAKLLEARRRIVWVRNVASLAAVLVLGVGLGALLTRGSWAPGGETNVSAGAPVIVAVTHPAPQSTGGFWSAARLARTAQKAQQNDNVRWIWESPARRPKLGGAS